MTIVPMARYENGLTVAQLKAIIKDWPETNDETGEPNEVWLGDGRGLSNQAREVSPLNWRASDKKDWADLILSHDA